MKVVEVSDSIDIRFDILESWNDGTRKFPDLEGKTLRYPLRRVFGGDIVAGNPAKGEHRIAFRPAGQRVFLREGNEYVLLISFNGEGNPRILSCGKKKDFDRALAGISETVALDLVQVYKVSFFVAEKRKFFKGTVVQILETAAWYHKTDPTALLQSRFVKWYEKTGPGDEPEDYTEMAHPPTLPKWIPASS